MAGNDGAGLTISEAAEVWGVARDTVRRWVTSGILPAHRLPSGHLRFDFQAVERLRRIIEAEPEAVVSA